MGRRDVAVGMLAVAVLVAGGSPAAAQFGPAPQIDLSGNWSPLMHEDWQERAPGPEAVDLLGMPVSDEARTRALTYTSSSLSLPERQCLYYPPHYLVMGPFGFSFWSDTDPVTGEVIAWHISPAVDRAAHTIWMDGRPRPPEGALHTFAGFTTGEWRGRNTLRTVTTHVKEGYFRRNGVPSSDRAILTMEFTRYGDLLTVTAFMEDPVYLTEPWVISRTWRLDPNANINRVAFPCVPQAELPGLVGDGDVPHYLPGENLAVLDLTNGYNIPVVAVMGGAETMYPEYRDGLREAFELPDGDCERYCCGWEGGGPEIDIFRGPLTCTARTTPQSIPLP